MMVTIVSWVSELCRTVACLPPLEAYIVLSSNIKLVFKEECFRSDPAQIRGLLCPKGVLYSAVGTWLYL